MVGYLFGGPEVVAEEGVGLFYVVQVYDLGKVFKGEGKSLRLGILGLCSSAGLQGLVWFD